MRFWLRWLFPLLLWSCQSLLGYIVVERHPNQFVLVHGTETEVFYQGCGNHLPTSLDLKKSLTDCTPNTTQRPYTVGRGPFEQSLVALHGVATPLDVGDQTISDIALELERTDRQVSGDSAAASELAEYFQAGVPVAMEYLVYLSEGRKEIRYGDALRRSLMWSAFYPAFSDGKTIFRLSTPVSMQKFHEACGETWITGSVSSVISSPRLAQLIAWNTVVKGGSPVVWASHPHFRIHQVDRLQGYTEEDPVVALSLNPNLLSQPGLKLSLEKTNFLAVGELELGESIVTVDARERRQLPVICYRRTLPTDPVVTGTMKTISLEEIARRFGRQGAGNISRRISQDEEIDREIGVYLLHQREIPEERYGKIESRVRALLTPGVLPLAQVQKQIAAEKKEAARKEQARLAQEAAEKRAAAQREWQRRQDEIAAAKQRAWDTNDGYGFTLDGRHFNTVQEAKRAYPNSTILRRGVPQ